MVIVFPEVEYDKSSRVLPKGVYLNKQGTYDAKVWSVLGSPQRQVGTYITPEEAEYRRYVYMYGHHWQGLTPRPVDMWGFIYKITCKKTGKMYIGKKQFRLWTGPAGGYKCTDPTNKDYFDPSAWKENDWQLYTGSQKDLNMEIGFGNVWDFTYEIIDHGQDKLDLHMAEVNEQIDKDVLEALDDNGQFLYYNKNIASLEFRAPFLKQDMKDARSKSLDDMRKYYLKPFLCPKCEKVIPYKESCLCLTSS